MQGVKIARPRILRSSFDRPLTLDEIRGAAPAVFQTEPYRMVSASYAYLPTITILNAMLAEGFTCHEVAQARPYTGDRDPYAKHMLRLRYPQKEKSKVGDFIPEIVLINAHDGTARYYLYAGVYRLVCSNGMVVGDTFAKIVVAHRGGEITRSRVIEGSYSIVNEEMPKVIHAVADMRGRELTGIEQLEFAERALRIRYGDAPTTLLPDQLLERRRPDDSGNDLWTIFNVVQEKLIQGGMSGRSQLFGRRTTARPVERVDSIVGINRGLWNEAQKYLETIQ